MTGVEWPGVSEQQDKLNPRGPSPDRLKLGGSWRDRVRESFKKQRPPDGFPGKQVPADEPGEPEETPSDD